MARVLVVRAHPFDSSVSRSMKVLDAFLEEYKALNPYDRIKDMNLYEVAIPEIDRDLLTAGKELSKGVLFDQLTSRQQEKVTLFNHYTDDFVSMDKIIIANPLWNMHVPSRLKTWIDTITVAGQTFRYTESGAVGMVPDKKLLHIQANGGIFDGSDPASQYIKSIFHFLGVEEISQLFVEGMDTYPDRADEIVADAIEKAKQLAKTF